MTMPAQNAREATLRWTTRSLAASGVGLILSVPTKMINAAVLGAGGLGLIEIANLVGKYAAYFDLGIKDSLKRQVPLAIGANDLNEAELVKAVSFTWTCVVSVIVLCVLWILFSMDITFKGLLTLSNLVLLSLMGVVDRLTAYLHVLAKAIGEFGLVGKNEVRLAFLRPGVMLPAVITLGVTGFLLGRLLLALFLFAAYFVPLYRSGVVSFRSSFDVSKFIELLKLGLLLWAIAISGSMYWSIDMTLLGFLGTKEEVGLFGFAIGMLTLAISTSGPIVSVAMRQMLTERGAQKDRHDDYIFHRYLEAPFVAYLLLVSIILGFTFFFYDVLIRLFLSEFLPAIPVFKVVLLGHMFFSTVYFTGAILNAAGQLKRRLYGVLICFVLNGVIDAVVISQGHGIYGVAWVSTFSYILFAGMFLLSCSKLIHGGYQAGLLFSLRYSLASVVLISCIYALDVWHVGQMDEGLAGVQWAMTIVRHFALALLKVLVFAGLALLVYSLLFSTYRPVYEIGKSVRYVCSFIRHGFREKLVAS